METFIPILVGAIIGSVLAPFLYEFIFNRNRKN